MTEAGSRPTGLMAQQLADLISDQMISGKLPVGHVLPTERTLAQTHGVSRQVIRETITILADRGLLTRRPGCRPIVRFPDLRMVVDSFGVSLLQMVADASTIANVFQSRVFVEKGLAREAAKSVKSAELDHFREALRDNEEAIGDSELFDATDVTFHSWLYHHSKNPIYPAIHQAYVAWLSEAWGTMPRGVQMDRLHYSGHVSIFNAIAGRDPDAAEQAVERHLHVAWEFVRSTVSSLSVKYVKSPLSE